MSLTACHIPIPVICIDPSQPSFLLTSHFPDGAGTSMRREPTFWRQVVIHTHARRIEAGLMRAYSTCRRTPTGEANASSDSAKRFEHLVVIYQAIWGQFAIQHFKSNGFWIIQVINLYQLNSVSSISINIQTTTAGTHIRPWDGFLKTALPVERIDLHRNSRNLSSWRSTWQNWWATRWIWKGYANVFRPPLKIFKNHHAMSSLPTTGTTYDPCPRPAVIGFGVWHLKHTFRFKKLRSLHDGQFLSSGSRNFLDHNISTFPEYACLGSAPVPASVLQKSRKEWTGFFWHRDSHVYTTYHKPYTYITLHYFTLHCIA
jgi:hypothetical protein